MACRIEPATSEQVRAVREAVLDLLATHGVEGLVTAYFDPAGSFAGDTFQMLRPNEPNRVGEVDLLAVMLLVPVSPRAVRHVLACADAVERDLAVVPADVALWEAEDRHLVDACKVFERLDDCDGVGEVIAGKLLARKRPALVPIVDKHVRRVLRLPDGRAWTSLREVLKDEKLRDRIARLQPGNAGQQPTIRLLDVAAWMRGSDGRSAKGVRAALGIS